MAVHPLFLLVATLSACGTAKTRCTVLVDVLVRSGQWRAVCDAWACKGERGQLKQNATADEYEHHLVTFSELPGLPTHVASTTC